MANDINAHKVKWGTSNQWMKHKLGDSISAPTLANNFPNGVAPAISLLWSRVLCRGCSPSDWFIFRALRYCLILLFRGLQSDWVEPAIFTTHQHFQIAFVFCTPFCDYDKEIAYFHTKGHHDHGKQMKNLHASYRVALHRHSPSQMSDARAYDNWSNDIHNE